MAENGALVVTYAIVEQTMTFKGAENCPTLTTLGDLVTRSGLDRARVRQELSAAFDMWSQVAAISFREVSDVEHAGILIGAQGDPDGHAYTELSLGRDEGGIKEIKRALVCLNPQKNWKIGFGGSLQVYDLRYTFAHEIGHAIGLDHPDGFTSLMAMRYDEAFRTLQPTDVAGAQYLYGRAGSGLEIAKGRSTGVPAPFSHRAAVSGSPVAGADTVSLPVTIE
jgi:hypothetical protein